MIIYAAFIICVTARLFWPSFTSEVIDSDRSVEFSATTINVLSGNQNHHVLSRYLLESQSDVIVAVEITPQWEGVLLKALSEAYPYHISSSRIDSFGMLLLSRYPLSEKSVSSLGSYGLPMISTVVSTPEKQVSIFGVHPIPPMGSQEAENNLAYLAVVAESVKKENDRPVLVLGDFNATPWSAHYSQLMSVTQLQNAATRQPFLTTWSPFNLPVLGLQLDHILYSSEFSLCDIDAGPFNQSDHRPVTARFFWK